MAKNQGKITSLTQVYMHVWRSTTVWSIFMYFGLITLNVWLNHFVTYYFPLQLIGWCIVINAGLYLLIVNNAEKHSRH